jgi:hypothetical protein
MAAASLSLRSAQLRRLYRQQRATVEGAPAAAIRPFAFDDACVIRDTPNF